MTMGMKWKRVLALGSALVLASGCFTTKVYSGRSPEGPQYESRQWFLLNGLAQLSPPAGQQCTHGVATTESSAGAVDILISAGLGVVGGVVGASACGGQFANPVSAMNATMCMVGGANLLPWLLATRTVTYTCAAGPRGAALQPERSKEELLSDMLRPQPAARPVAAPGEQTPAAP